MLTFKELGKYGRLGNQMFQIAGTIGLALKNNWEYGFPKWINHDHKNRFGSSEDVNVQDYFVNELPLINENINYTDRFIQWGYHDLKDIHDNTNLIGHMQSEKYFEHCKEVIFHYFKLKELSDYLIEPNSIALHIRLGDYDDNYHPIQKKEYYEKALKLMPKEKVYVFSDNPEDAKKLLGDEHTYLKGNHYMIDFYLMTKCKHFILSNSTFCWWAWWLSERGICIAPSNWFGKIAGINANDIYTNEMIIL